MLPRAVLERLSPRPHREERKLEPWWKEVRVREKCPRRLAPVSENQLLGPGIENAPPDAARRPFPMPEIRVERVLLVEQPDGPGMLTMALAHAGFEVDLRERPSHP